MNKPKLTNSVIQFWTYVCVLLCIPGIMGDICVDHYSGAFPRTRYCASGCCGSYSSQTCCSSTVGSITVRLIGGIITTIVFVCLFVGIVICCCRRRRIQGTVVRNANPTVVYSNNTVMTSGMQPGVAAYPQQNMQYPSTTPYYPPTVPSQMPNGYDYGYASSPPNYESLNFAPGKDNKGYDNSQGY